MQNEYEYLICPDTSLDVSLITRKIKAKNRISFETKWNSLFYSSRVKKPPQYHEALRLISLLGPVDMNLSIDFDSYSSGDQVAVPEWASMSLRPHFDSKKEVLIDLKKQFSIDPRKYAIFAPGIERETKKWLPDGFRIVMEQIAKKGFQVLILGTFSEKEFCDKLASEIPNAMSLAGKVSLYQMTHLMTDAEFVLCNDSAAMHLASIADTPTISLFGPTTAQKGFGPWQNRALVVEKGELACRPCKRLDHRACPLGTHDCMKLITPEEVLAAIKDLTQDPNTLSH